MAIEVNVLDKYETYCMFATVSYTCPHCGESVIETIAFSKGTKNCIALCDDQTCPECGESNDLEVDLY